MSRAETQWDKADKSYRNYIGYINRKSDKFELSLIDLLFVSNFKGGNASIHEEESSVNRKLGRYSELLREISSKLGVKSLRQLTEEELVWLTEKAYSFVCLTLDGNTAIDGFKVSYASALLHFCFPELVPILDRRVLNGAGIKVELNKQGQVISIEKYYPHLFRVFYDNLRDNPLKSLRDLDKEFFTKEFNETLVTQLYQASSR